jgi:seryl-tRNA synthetase
MLDIALIREKSEWVKAQIARLNDTAPIDEIVGLDGRRRQILQEVEELRRQRKQMSKRMGIARIGDATAQAIAQQVANGGWTNR